MSLSAYALTSLADCTAYLRTPASDDALVTELINAATNLIEKVCRRKFAARDHRERFNGTGKDSLVLKQWPVISITRIAVGDTPCLGVTYTGAHLRAQAYIKNDDSLVVKTINNTTGAASTDTFDYSDYPTTSLIAAAIGGVSGWAATASVNVLCTDLSPRTMAVKNTVGYFVYPDEDIADLTISYADGVIGINSLRAAGRETRYGAFPVGFRNILVDYRAGFENAQTNNDCAELSKLCRDFVGAAYARRGLNTNLKSESLGDFAQTLMNGVELSVSQNAALKNWAEGRVMVC